MTNTPRCNRPRSSRFSRSFIKRLSSWLALSTALTVASTQNSTVKATDYYWDATGTGLWSNGANWSDIAGGNTGFVPLAADMAFFNQAGFYGDTVVQLDGATSIGGITFSNTGTTLIDASSPGSQTLTIGSSGLTINAGAGAVTIGDATNHANVVLGAAQSWLNNSSNTLNVVDAVNNGGFLLTVGGSGATTLGGVVSGAGGITLAGTGIFVATRFDTGVSAAANRQKGRGR